MQGTINKIVIKDEVLLGQDLKFKIIRNTRENNFCVFF